MSVVFKHENGVLSLLSDVFVFKNHQRIKQRPKDKAKGKVLVFSPAPFCCGWGCPGSWPSRTSGSQVLLLTEAPVPSSDNFLQKLGRKSEHSKIPFSICEIKEWGSRMEVLSWVIYQFYNPVEVTLSLIFHDRNNTNNRSFLIHSAVVIVKWD